MAPAKGLHTVMIEREAPGGQAGLSSRIENYLGFPSGLSGNDLARRAVAQARRFGVEILAPQEAVSIRAERSVSLPENLPTGLRFLSRASPRDGRSVADAGSARDRALAGRGRLLWRRNHGSHGLQGEIVHIIGTARIRGQAAMHFRSRRESLFMLVRGESLGTMSHYLIEQIEKTPISKSRRVAAWPRFTENHGLTGLTILRSLTGEKEQVPATSLYIFIGAQPRTNGWAHDRTRRARFHLSGPDLLRGERDALVDARS